MKKENEWLAEVGFKGAIWVIMAILFFCFARGVEAVECADLESVTGRATTFRFFSGCYVEVNERQIPLDSWRGEESK